MSMVMCLPTYYAHNRRIGRNRRIGAREGLKARCFAVLLGFIRLLRFPLSPLIELTFKAPENLQSPLETGLFLLVVPKSFSAPSETGGHQYDQPNQHRPLPNA